MRNYIHHFGRMFGIALCFSLMLISLAPESLGGRFWVGSALLLFTPLILLGRYSTPNFGTRQRAVLRSPRRGRIHCMELFGCMILSLFLGTCAVGELSFSALALGLWGAFLCGLASVVEQRGTARSVVLVGTLVTGTLLWTCPLWLGPWLGEAAFTPWLASWIMWLHPVSLALSLSELSNLIEPIFYSITLIGVIEVELFNPNLGLVVLGAFTMVFFAWSYVLNRRRSASDAVC